MMTTPVNAQPIIDWFFEHGGAENLGAAVGLTPEVSRRVLADALPRQLQVLADYSRTPVGAEQITEAVRIIPYFPSVNQALGMGNGALDLERAGESMAPTLMREHRLQLPDAVAAGANREGVGRLLQMTLPLILSRLSWRDDVAQRFLPLVGDVPVKSGKVLIPTDAAVAPVQRVSRAVVTESASRRSGFPWWIVPLALLLLLGGCLMLRPQNNTKTAAEATAEAKASPVSSEFAITNPAPGAQVSANGFTVEGSGPVDATYTMHRAGEQVGTFTVGKDNRWHVDVLDAAAPAGDVVYTFRDAEGKDVGTLNVKASGLEGTNITPVTITEPQANTEVSAGGFNIQGVGQPGATYQAFEDGANIGGASAGPDGTWAIDVPGPNAGPHTYTVLDSHGNRVALIPVNVTSSGGGSCTDALNISLNNNETVSAPFRFGGRGSGKGYTVTVWRGSEQVGTRDVNLSGDCTWSYASNPGGKDGEKSTVRYEVRPAGADVNTPATGQVTLNVSGSGTNFQNGQYVGPTK